MFVSSFFQLYRECESIEVSIESDICIDIKCQYGKQRDCDCEIHSIGTLIIPIGDIDKFVILKSPILYCTIHCKEMVMYLSDASRKVYIGKNTYINNNICWYTLISYNDKNDNASKYLSRRYHVTDRFLQIICTNIFHNGVSIPDFIRIIHNNYMA